MWQEKVKNSALVETDYQPSSYHQHGHFVRNLSEHSESKHFHKQLNSFTESQLENDGYPWMRRRHSKEKTNANSKYLIESFHAQTCPMATCNHCLPWWLPEWCGFHMKNKSHLLLSKVSGSSKQCIPLHSSGMQRRRYLGEVGSHQLSYFQPESSTQVLRRNHR